MRTLHDTFVYDPEGFLRYKERPGNKSFNTKWAGKRAGSLDAHGYVQIPFGGRNRKEHQLVWEMHYGPIPPGKEPDHEDGVRHHNKIGNLRLVTHSGNMQNGSLQKRNKSGHIGVGWHKASGKWRAFIAVNGIPRHLGLFLDIADAIAAQQAAAKKYGYHENHGKKRTRLA